MQGYAYCYSHRDDLADERRRHARKGGMSGGRGRPNSELVEIRSILRELTEGVISGEIDTGPAAVAGQLLNARIRAVEVSRRSLDMGELLERLEAVEQAADRLRGAS